jgi:hypothetical protein
MGGIGEGDRTLGKVGANAPEIALSDPAAADWGALEFEDAPV